MTRIDGLSTTGWPPLRIAHAARVPAQSTRAGTREEHLAKALDERLNRTLQSIRTNLTAAPAPSSPGTGEHLDIVA